MTHNHSSPHDDIRAALDELNNATRRLTNSLLGQQPAHHLRKSLQHAILAASSSIDQFADRVQSCQSRGTDHGHSCDKPPHTEEQAHDPHESSNEDSIQEK